MLWVILLGLAIFGVTIYWFYRVERGWNANVIACGGMIGLLVGIMGGLFGGALISDSIGRSLEYQWVQTEKTTLAPWSYDEEPDRMYIVQPPPKFYYLGRGKVNGHRYYYFNVAGVLLGRRDRGNIEVYDSKAEEPYFRGYTRKVAPKHAGYCKWLAFCDEGRMRYECYVPLNGIKENLVVIE